MITAAFAQDQADGSGLFAGLNAGLGFRSGTSYTTDGGAAFGGGGAVHGVKFSEAYAIGGHFGYRFNPSLAMHLSVEHITGGVSWISRFAAGGETYFNGTAVSDLVLLNATYTHSPLANTYVNLTAGVGFSINSLKDVGEGPGPTAPAFASLADETKVDLAAKVGVGIEHAINSSVKVGADASLAYVGGYTTGKYRTFGGVADPITPYEIDNTWGATVSGSLEVDF